MSAQSSIESSRDTYKHNLHTHTTYCNTKAKAKPKQIHQINRFKKNWPIEFYNPKRINCEETKKL